MNARLIAGCAGVAAAVGIAGWFGLSSIDRPSRGADATDAELVALGTQVYAARCGSCHGAALEGQPDWQSALPQGGFPAPPHDETGHTWHHSDALLFDYVSKGGQEIGGPSFKSNMPGFGQDLSDREIWAVLAFIKSTWPEQVRERQASISAADR